MHATRRTALFAAMAGSAAGCAHARTTPEAHNYVLPNTTVVPLHSATNGVDYLLYVRTPANYEASDGRLPVIVTLDADYSFSVCANHLEHLADRMNQAPNAILVSIAVAGIYPDMRRYREERTRDYTPIFFPTGGYGPAFQARSGGGPAFLRMIEQEALPLIDARYRTSGVRTLVGHSYGGLFTGWVLQARPDLFENYLLVSPSLWYADRWIFGQEQEKRLVRLPRRTRVYLAVGSWEEQPENNGFMVSELTRFAQMLEARGDPNLIVKHRVFEDETHASIFPAAFSTGIRHIHQTMD